MSSCSTSALDTPFVTVEGVINMRSIGGYATAEESLIVKPDHIYRSGEINRITERGVQHLLDIGIKIIFDFRSEREIAMYNTSSPSIDGVTFVHPPPIISAEAFSPSNVITLLKRYEANEVETFIEEYLCTLKKAGPTYRPVFEHLRDYPNQPCLFHCTAGKDRTGLLAAVILMLLGVSDEDISNDYALTTKGLEPVAEQMTERYLKMDIFRDNWSAFLKMGSSRKKTMEALLPEIRRSFGSAEGYARDIIGLSEDDISKIRENMLVDSN